ncbi:hypothetical protein D3C80_1875440 [compost metagenome]
MQNHKVRGIAQSVHEYHLRNAYISFAVPSLESNTEYATSSLFFLSHLQSSLAQFYRNVSLVYALNHSYSQHQYLIFRYTLRKIYTELPYLRLKNGFA